jgi:hypothetical protein
MRWIWTQMMKTSNQRQSKSSVKTEIKARTIRWENGKEWSESGSEGRAKTKRWKVSTQTRGAEREEMGRGDDK